MRGEKVSDKKLPQCCFFITRVKNTQRCHNSCGRFTPILFAEFDRRGKDTLAVFGESLGTFFLVLNLETSLH
jgi:hypothetical protein